MKINWSLLLLKLRKYHSFREIEKQTGVCRVHMARLSRGEVVQPKFEQGVLLLDWAYDALPENEFEVLRNDY